MTAISRRTFLALAPASVGALAFMGLGAPKAEPLPPLVVADGGPIRDIASSITVEDLLRARDMLDANDVPHGLSHLEGETVDVWADGKPMLEFAFAEQTITIELSEPANRVYVSVPYSVRG